MSMIKHVAVNEPSILFFQTEESVTVNDIIVRGIDGLEDWDIDVSTLGNDLYVLEFTPLDSGEFAVVAAGVLVAQLEVSEKTPLQYLRDLEDEAMGSWRWDKDAGTLLLVRQDGTDFASFAVTDSLTEASRERL